MLTQLFTKADQKQQQIHANGPAALNSGEIERQLHAVFLTGLTIGNLSNPVEFNTIYNQFNQVIEQNKEMSEDVRAQQYVLLLDELREKYPIKNTQKLIHLDK